MTRIDEEFINLKKLSKENKLKLGKIGSIERGLVDGVLKKEVNIEKLKIEFEETKIMDNVLEILLPKNFKLMNEEIIKIKYPRKKEGAVIYTNEESTIDLSFSCSGKDLEDVSLENIKNSIMTNMIKNSYGTKFFENGIDNFTGIDIAFIDTLNEVEGIGIYSFLMFMLVNKSMYICNFVCTESDMKYWCPIFKGMMKSIKIIKS